MPFETILSWKQMFFIFTFCCAGFLAIVELIIPGSAQALLTAIWNGVFR